MAETIARDPLYQDKVGYEGMLNEVGLVPRTTIIACDLTPSEKCSASQLCPRYCKMRGIRRSCQVSSRYLILYRV